MAAKKRFLHLIQTLESGGCENMLLRTLPHLEDSEHRIITLRQAGTLAPRFEAAGIPVWPLGQRSLADIASYRRLVSEIRSFAPQAVLTYLFRADIIGRLFIQWQLRLPVIPFLRTTYNDWRYLPARLFERLTRRFVPRYLANSDAVKAYYVRRIGVQEERITVIPNGIDTSIYAGNYPETLRASLGIGPEEVVVICVANLHPNKGHRYLLEAFDVVAEGHAELKLLLVGDGVERENLETLARRLGSREQIRFLGKRSDVPALLALSDIFVLPTFFEGLSNALLEAMAAGLACITTDIPENRQLITDEVNGLLSPSKDSRALAGLLGALVRDRTLMERLGNNARRSVTERFSIDQVIREWKDFLSHT